MPGTEPKKIVLKPSTPGATATKASDVTQMSPAASSDGIKDPMDMRNTDTGSMKRMEVSDAGGKKARRTIKLKPLSPKGAAATEEQDTAETLSMSRDELEETANLKSQILGPKATITLNPPGAQPTGGGEDDEDATVKVQKPSLDGPTAAETAAAPAPPPSQVPTQDAVAIGADEEDVVTKKVKKPSVPGAKQTIKLRPSSSAPTAASPSASATASSTKPASSKATIKLKPMAKEEEESVDDEKTIAMAKQTIRLVPKGQDAVPTTDTAATKTEVKPSAPTVQMTDTASLPGEQITAVSTKAPTQVKPSAPTTKLPAEEPQAKPTASKPTLKLKASGGSSSPAAASSDSSDAGPAPTTTAPGVGMDEPEDDVEVADEPNIVFTAVAVLALVATIYLAFALFAQFGNYWMDGVKVDVPFMSGKVK